MALSAQEWKNFLTEAGIPDNEAKTYSQSFFENRIQKPEDLSRDVLKELGVTILGDAIAIARAAASSTKKRAHPATDTNTKSHYKTEY